MSPEKLAIIRKKAYDEFRKKYPKLNPETAGPEYDVARDAYVEGFIEGYTNEEMKQTAELLHLYKASGDLS